VRLLRHETNWQQHGHDKVCLHVAQSVSVCQAVVAAISWSTHSMDDCTHSQTGPFVTAHGATVTVGKPCVTFGTRQEHHHAVGNMYERQVDAESWLRSLANSHRILQQD